MTKTDTFRHLQDGNGNDIAQAVQFDDVAGTTTPYQLEDKDQRADLIAALGFGRAGTVLSATIEANQSLSDPVILGANRASWLIMPENWAAAVLTFQVSIDGQFFFDLYDQYDEEYSIQVDASHAVLLPFADFKDFPFLKVRSGPGGGGINQSTSLPTVIQIIAVP